MGYQNILLHCGINDIRDKSPGRLPSDPEPVEVEAHFELLRRKIYEIKKLCPKASIFVSPILPTKNLKLNRRVLQFNSSLFNYLANGDSEGVRSFDYNEFVNDNGILKEELGTWDMGNGCFNTKDILHLGKAGVRILAKIVKQGILHKMVNKRSYRDTLDTESRGPQPPR